MSASHRKLSKAEVLKRGAALAQARAASTDPIPTRPVQKHFSEARDEGSGIPWPIYVKIAVYAVLIGAVAAVVVFVMGAAR